MRSHDRALLKAAVDIVPKPAVRELTSARIAEALGPIYPSAAALRASFMYSYPKKIRPAAGHA
jgi:hypothetical protein